MEKTKRIVLKPRTPYEIPVNSVAITPEAAMVIGRLRARSGLNTRQIVSEILIQSEKLVDIDNSYMTKKGETK